VRKFIGDRNQRALWLKGGGGGDSNTRFFHKVANSHRRYNHMEGLRINGILSHNPVEIKDHVVQFYQRLYSERSTWRPKIDNQVFSSIDEDEKNWLERDFEEEEVWEVVKGMEGDKAPGLDGFTMAFFSIVLGCGEERCYGCFFSNSIEDGSW
jgi:hypothetical protein